jgi:hypothetical protein
MSELSPILALPLLMPAQAQKHVTHNEALARLDILVQLSVESFGATTPPAAPTEGEVHALGTGATGAWAGEDGKLAARSGGAWVFVAPRPGWRAWGRAEAALRVWTGTAWTPPPPGDLDNLDGVGIGTGSDPVNRLAVASEAVLLSHAGAGMQVKLNKAAAADTASLLMQTDFSGRAEIGLAGNDDLSVKVSADGSAWNTALSVVAASGQVGIGTAAPARALHVNDVLRLSPRATAPAGPAAGDIYFDSTLGKLRCHDGSAWKNLY